MQLPYRLRIRRIPVVFFLALFFGSIFFFLISNTRVKAIIGGEYIDNARLTKSVFAADENVLIEMGEVRPEKIQASLLDSGGNTVHISTQINDLDGKTEVVIPPPSAFHPGRFQVTISNSLDHQVKQDFSWGVLAINPNKSIYAPNEEANIALAVLDDFGNMVCDAQIALNITNPNGETTTLSTTDSTIITNPECHLKQITQKPDYETRYTVAGMGTYRLELTAVTGNGSYSIVDGFEVQDPLEFSIERIAATRIYPRYKYPVAIKIIPKANFDGVVREYIPDSFEVTKGDFEIKGTDRGYKQLEWNVHLIADQETTLTYEYDGPDVSPEFFLLGPIEVYNMGNELVFKESRWWQLASDAIAVAQSVTGNTASATSFTLTSWTPGANELVVVAVAVRDETRTVTVSGNGLTFVEEVNLDNAQGQCGIHLFRAMGASPSTGQITVSIASNTLPAVAVATRFSGTDTTGTNGSGAWEAEATGAGPAVTDDANMKVNITTLTNNAFAYAAGTYRLGTFTTPGGETTISNNNIGGSGGDTTSVSAWYESVASAGTVTVGADADLDSNRDWAIASASIKPAPTGITVSGNVYNFGTASTALTECDGSALTLRLRASATTYSASCADANGSFSFTGVTQPSSGDGLVIWIEAITPDGALVIRYDGSGDSTGNVFYDDSVTVASDNSTAVDNADMDAYDNGNDTDIPYTVTSSNLTVNSGIQFNIYTGETYDPGGTVTTNATGGDFHVDDNATADIDTATTAIGRDILVDGGGTLRINANTTVAGGDITTSGTSATVTTTSGTPTVTISGTGTIGGGTTPSITIYNLTTSGTGTTTIGSSVTVSNDLSVGTSTTVNGTNNLTVNGGDITGSGTIGMTGGTVNLNGTGSFGSATSWSFSSLTFGSGSSGTTTAASTSNITVSSVLTVSSNQTLDAGSKTWKLTGNGSPFVVNGTFTANTSTVSYENTTSATVKNTTYYNLQFSPASGTPTYTLSAGAGAGTVTHQETVTGSTPPTATSVTSASITGASNQLYLAAVSTKRNGNPYGVTSMSGLGLTWTQVIYQCGGRDQTNVEIWKAMGSASTGTVTANVQNAHGAAIAVSRYSGIDTSTPIGNTLGWNTVGDNDTTCSGGTDVSTYTTDITTTGANSVVYGAIGERSRTNTPGSGYTERADVQSGAGGSDAGVAVQDKTVASASTVAFDGTSSTTVDYAIAILELLPAPATGGTLTVNNDFTIAGVGNATVDAETNDPNIDINGSVSIGSGDTLTTSSSANFTVAGSWTNSGTLTEGTGTVTFDGSTNMNLNSGCSNVSTCTTQNFYNIVINKTNNSSTVTLLTNGIRATNRITVMKGNLVQGALNIRSEGTTAISIGSTGSWTNLSTGDVILGGSVSNSGVITLQGNGTACTDANDISITSTTAAVQRSWTGSGAFNMNDLTVQDQGGTASIVVYGGSSVSGNGTNWTFTSSCPVVLMSKSASTIQVDVQNKYRAVLTTTGSLSSHELLQFYDLAQSSTSPTKVIAYTPYYIRDAGNTYHLEANASRLSYVVESSDIRVKLRVEGCLYASSCLTDGTNQVFMRDEYTFTTEGMFVHTYIDAKNGVALTSGEVGESRIDWNEPASGATHSETILYGDGTTEASTAVDGGLYDSDNNYIMIQGTGAYQNILFGMANKGARRRLSNANRSFDQLYYEVDNFGFDETELAYFSDLPDVTLRSTGEYDSFMLFKSQTASDTEVERETLVNSIANPDTPAYVVGSEWDDAPATNGVDFNGTVSVGAGADTSVSLVDNAYDALSAGTIEFWFKGRDTGDGTQAMFGINDATNSAGNGMEIRYDSTNNRVAIWSAGCTSTNINAFVSLANQTSWHHLAWVVGASSNTLYIDGVAQTLSYTTGTSSSNCFVDDVAENTTKYAIGCDYVSTTSCTETEMYEGWIEEVRIWNVARTASEIQTNMNKQISTSSSGLAGYFRFNENSGTTVNDETSNNNDGTFNLNSAWSTGYVPDRYNEGENIYTLDASSNKARVDLNGATYNRIVPWLKMRNYRLSSSPSPITLEGNLQTNLTDYNIAIKPFSSGHYFTSSDGSYTRLANGGDQVDINEFLNDPAHDYTLPFASGDFMYLGSDVVFSGVTTTLTTLAAGTSPTLLWQYCSVNADPVSACDTWSTLTVTDTTSGAKNMTASGNFFFTPPYDWARASVNSGSSYHWIRASLGSGTLSTSPVESLIRPDVVLFQYLGTLTLNNQTFELPQSLPTNSQLMRGGKWFNSAGVRQPFTF